jgi:hypothetical protein
MYLIFQVSKKVAVGWGSIQMCTTAYLNNMTLQYVGPVNPGFDLKAKIRSKLSLNA